MNRHLLFPALVALCAALGSPPANAQTSTTTALAVSSNSVTLGQSITATATVTPGTATGKVTFYDGVTVLGVGALSSGTATLPNISLPAGMRSLKAYYAGDSGDSPSISTTVPVTVTTTSSDGFGVSASYAAGIGADFAALADFNGDGLPDIAVADRGATISILLGSSAGDGMFTIGQVIDTSPNGLSPSSITTGDFNGDGFVDLAVADIDSGAVTIVLGNGDGTFQAPTAIVVGGNPTAIAAADVDNNGTIDLLVADKANDILIVLLGDGTGAFTEHGTGYPAGLHPAGIAVADFNGDGKPDVALAVLNSTKVSVMQGAGDGSFTLISQPNVGALQGGLVAADFNGDGKMDIAIADVNGISILNGNNDFTFSNAVNYVAGTYPAGVATGDFNGDGKIDLLVTSLGGGGFNILMGGGDSTFQPPINVAAGSAPVDALTGEFNGDGKEDIILVNLDVNTVSVYLGSVRTTTALAVTPNPAVFGQAVTVTATVSPSIPDGSKATFYADAIVLGTANVMGSQAVLQTVTIPVGAHLLHAEFSGSPTFLPSASATVSETITAVAGSGFTALSGPTTDNTPSSVIVGDFNGDGKMDLAFANLGAGTITISLGNGTGGFTNQASVAVGIGPRSIAMGDFNEDGHPDLVTANSGGNNISVALGNGDGSYQTSVPYSVGNSPTGVTVGDFDGDGHADIAVTNLLDNTVSVLRGNGDGTFQAAVNYPAGSGPVAMAVGSFNGDNRADAAVADSTGNSVSVLTAGSGGKFGPPASYPVGTNPVAIAVGDVNGDSNQDIVVANQGSNTVSVLLSNGDGTFQNAVSYAVGNSPTGVTIGDFDGDGHPDIVVSDQTSNDVNILMGKGDGTFTIPAVAYALPASGTAPSPAGVAVGDFNGDGRMDIVTANGATSDSTILNARAVTTTTISLSHNPSTASEPLTLTATVSPSTATGTVTFYDGSTVLNAPVLLTGGVATLVLSSITVGNHSFTVSYPGDVNNGPSASAAVVDQAVAALAITQGDQQNAVINSSFVTPLKVAVTTGGVPAVGVTVVFTAPASGATGLFAGSGGTASVVTGSDGTAAAPAFTANGTAGGYLVSATANSNTVNFGLTNTSSSCTFTVSPTALYYDMNGGNTTITLTASSPSCPFGAVSTVPWLTLANANGTGNGSVNVAVSVNSSGVSQTGTIFAAGQAIAVTEWGTAQTFADVNPTDFFFDAANYMSNLHVTSGCSTSPALDYCPNDNVTRAQMAIFLVRSVYGGDTFPYSMTPHFTDVGPTDFGFSWIQALYELGITTGCTPTTFCPADSVTRAQMAIFIIRTRYGAASDNSFTYPPTPFFTDVPTTGFGFKWIQRMKVDNVTTGCSTTLYCPTDPVTRGQMAVFITRGNFDYEFPVVEPYLSSISPSTIPAGQTTTVTVNGVNTHFVQGTTTVSPIPGVTIGTITVSSASSFTVDLTPSADEAPESIHVITGTEEAVIPNALKTQ